MKKSIIILLLTWACTMSVCAQKKTRSIVVGTDTFIVKTVVIGIGYGPKPTNSEVVLFKGEELMMYYHGGSGCMGNTFHVKKISKMPGKNKQIVVEGTTSGEPKIVHIYYEKINGKYELTKEEH